MYTKFYYDPFSGFLETMIDEQVSGLYKYIDLIKICCNLSPLLKKFILIDNAFWVLDGRPTIGRTVTCYFITLKITFEVMY